MNEGFYSQTDEPTIELLVSYAHQNDKQPMVRLPSPKHDEVFC